MGVMLPPFQAFLDAHREGVYRFLSCVVPHHEVDDCFQETFLAALRAYPRVRAESDLRAWVMTIAYRKALDAHRGRARRPTPVAEVPDAPMGNGADISGLWALVLTLPAKQRAAIVHRYAIGLRYREIGQIVGCSEEAARQNVREGLKKLKELV